MRQRAGKCTARLALAFLLAGVPAAVPAQAPAPAQALGVTLSLGLGDLFGFRGGVYDGLAMSDRELQSLGCVAMGTGLGVITVLAGGTAAAVAGGRGLTAASAVAMPVLAATMAAGCAFGSQAAPGLAWLTRNSEILFGRVIPALPSLPAPP